MGVVTAWARPLFDHLSLWKIDKNLQGKCKSKCFAKEGTGESSLLAMFTQAAPQKFCQKKSKFNHHYCSRNMWQESCPSEGVRLQHFLSLKLLGMHISQGAVPDTDLSVHCWICGSSNLGNDRRGENFLSWGASLLAVLSVWDCFFANWNKQITKNKSK